jgi:hypothetical protein
VTGVAATTSYEKRRVQLDDPLVKYTPELVGLRVYAGEDSSEKPVLETTARAVPTGNLMRRSLAGVRHADRATSAVVRLFATASDNRSSTPTEVCQSMQPSVMLWP